MEHYCEIFCDTQLKEKFHQGGLEKFYKTRTRIKILSFTNMVCRWFRYKKHLCAKDDGIVLRGPNSYIVEARLVD